MELLTTLKREHDIILKTLEAFEVYAGGVAVGSWTREGDLGGFVTFCRRYVAELHQTEEELLFAAMATRGYSREKGPIKTLVADHEAAAALLSRLASMAFEVAPWMRAHRNSVADVACRYSRLLRAHIHKEQGVLLPLVHVSVMAHVARAMDQAHRERMMEPGATQARLELEVMAGELGARYLADSAWATRGLSPRRGALPQAAVR